MSGDSIEKSYQSKHDTPGLESAKLNCDKTAARKGEN